jgi:putative transposase
VVVHGGNLHEPTYGRHCNWRDGQSLACIVSFAATQTLSKAVQALKTNSSKWMNDQGMRFAWQEGYSAFSVSVSSTPAVVNYIRNQENHHRKISFEDEYVALLKKHGIEFDPKYVFG